MGALPGLFAASKGKEVEVVLAGQQGRIVGILESVDPDSLQLRDGPDDVWVNLAAVVSVRVHTRTPAATGGDAKRSAATEPKTREVSLFCEECGYERIGREPASGEEIRAAGPGADQASATCPICGCTRWTRKRPQL